METIGAGADYCFTLCFWQDGDIAAKKAELELAAEEDFGRN